MGDGLLRSDRSALLLRARNAICHERSLLLVGSYLHESEPHVSFCGDLVWTHPQRQPARGTLEPGDHLRQVGSGWSLLALLLSGQRLVFAAVVYVPTGRLENVFHLSLVYGSAERSDITFC